jgi:hypothetical protein
MRTKKEVFAKIGRRSREWAKVCEKVIDPMLDINGECRVKLFYFYDMEVQRILREKYQRGGWTAYFNFDSQGAIWEIVVED